MENKTMGAIISAARKEQGLTQKDIADKLNITDKAVSKWERDLACPDINTIPKLAQILGISVDELLNTAPKANTKKPASGGTVDLILKAVPVAMGVAVAVTSILGTLDMQSGFSMLGIGLGCIGVYLLKNQ